MEILYTDMALKELTKISTGDKKSAQRIVSKIEEYAGNPEGKYDIKQLKGDFGGRLRMRVGDYRIIFKVDSKKMVISTIRQRQEAYND